MLSYKATVPANTTATLFLPITESMSEFEMAQGVKFIRKTTHLNILVAEYELKAGTFEFNIMERKGIFIKKQTEKRFTP